MRLTEGETTKLACSKSFFMYTSHPWKTRCAGIIIAIKQLWVSRRREKSGKREDWHSGISFSHMVVYDHGRDDGPVCYALVIKNKMGRSTFERMKLNISFKMCFTAEVFFLHSTVWLMDASLTKAFWLEKYKTCGSSMKTNTTKNLLAGICSSPWGRMLPQSLHRKTDEPPAEK